MSVTMRGATGVIVQPHQILLRPRKMTEICWKQMTFTLRDRSEHDPTMIREWNRQSATRGATDVSFRAHHKHFVWKNTTFHAPAIIPNFTTNCACHEKWHFNFTTYCACHEKWPIGLHQILRLPRKVTFQLHQILRLPRKVTLQLHQILRLPRKVTLIIDPCHTWNAIYNARSNRCHCPTEK